MKKELLNKTTPIALVAICLSAGCVTASSYGNFPVTEKSLQWKQKGFNILHRTNGTARVAQFIEKAFWQGEW
jgi:hypothetical protein